MTKHGAFDTEKSNLSKDQVKVMATGFFSLFSLIGIVFYGLPFFYDFLVLHFGWSRATVTSGTAFGRVVAALFSFGAGWLIDRYGSRKMILGGILMGGVAFIAMGSINSLWQFYVCCLLAALGYICGGPLPNQVLTARWFNHLRGRAMGIAYIGVGVGGMLVPQIARWLNKEWGWQVAISVLGVLIIIVAFPFAWFAKDKPENPEPANMGDPGPASLKKILKSPSFYFLLVGSACSIAAVSGTSQHLKLFFSLDLGYSQQYSANIISIILLSSIAGRLFMGWLADRIAKKYVMLLIYVLITCAIPMLYFIESPGVVYLFAIIFGIGLGGDYMIIPLMTAELVGVKLLGRAMGIILAVDILADALAPILVGWLRDKGGSYFAGFSTLIFLAFIGALAVLFIPKKTRQV